MKAVAWKPGAKQTGGNNASIKLFNGVPEPSEANLGDFWHTHTSGMNEAIVDGETQYYNSAPGPSPNDKQIAGYYPNSTAIQIDVFGKTVVNFINREGIILSMKYNDFLKIGKK